MGTTADTKFRFAIDRGGTFTDVHCLLPKQYGGGEKVLKLLSEDPSNYADAPREGIRRILQEVTGREHPRNEPLDTSQLASIRMGTTVATNALLERKGERTALVITKGLPDLLHIGTQARPAIFDLAVRTPEQLADVVVEVDERVQLFKKGIHDQQRHFVIVGVTGEKVAVTEQLNEDRLREQLQEVKDRGIKSLAVCLMHAYTFPAHEKRIGEIAREMGGFINVSLSHEVMSMVKIVPRGYTTTADAYLTPCIQRYIQTFRSGFDADFEKNVEILFMQSDGGLAPVEDFMGSRAILSGPAGGVVGYSRTSYGAFTQKRKDEGLEPKAVIGFDMGGTSTDVSRYGGTFEHTFENTTAGITIQAPQLDIATVAAGGGSRLFFRSGQLAVGPESAGAHPGPVCYRKNGFLAVTDANLMLGRIIPEYFPKIFGPNEDQPLDVEGSRSAFEALLKEVNDFNAMQTHSEHTPMSVEEVAYGFVKVANEAMCRPIRNITQSKGLDISMHTLSCFGGAGAQHACSIAAALGMRQVVIHRHSGILSAFGMALADIVYEEQEPTAIEFDQDSESKLAEIYEQLDKLAQKGTDKLLAKGFASDMIATKYFLHMRYDRTNTSIMISPEGENGNDFLTPFERRYKQEFGFIIPDRAIIVDDIRVRVTGSSPFNLTEGAWSDAPTEWLLPKKDRVVPAVEKTSVYFEEGWREDTGLVNIDSLSEGDVVPGPAIILEKNATIVVEPRCTAQMSKDRSVIIHVGYDINEGDSDMLGNRQVTEELDPIQLSIFGHRFMSIAEQMGRALQRTSISTNIKERLDFSCALFSPDGGLVANAPHIPVHLGAMQEAVRFQKEFRGKSGIKKGDVLVSNHPSAGGSHLPDITVITPVFDADEEHDEPVFFVACRGHHADIGGITPGSMPPNSVELVQEGAAIISHKLVSDGQFDEAGVLELFMKPGQVPGSSGCRNMEDVMADLRAQVAANQRGIVLLHELSREYGLSVVQAYMKHIQHNAEFAVRDMLREVCRRHEDHYDATTGKCVLNAVDSMDDGTQIKLQVTIDPKTGDAHFDFTGTGEEVYANTNAPRAVTYSAVIYSLRSMITHDIPLNQGCLKPITFNIPERCLLYPSDGAAVVAGNVLTSQRVTDVVLRAFSTCAASQGCCNNLTFGNERMGYYETIAGGAGAGPNWTGRSGVHTHMTNTRITDPEILERRYPVVLRTFRLRKGSGGAGAHCGGDGVERELEFLSPMTVSILSERRVFRPYGLDGGHDGARGRNIVLKNDGRVVNLGAKNSIQLSPGERFVILTPGGGGFGTPDVDTVASRERLTVAFEEGSAEAKWTHDHRAKHLIDNRNGQKRQKVGA
eukprot:Clim_evm16s149 gene=Clim_evmTU16s149